MNAVLCTECNQEIDPNEKIDTVLTVDGMKIVHENCETLADKTTPVMRSTIPTNKEYIMAETNDPTVAPTEETDETEVPQTRLQAFVNKHPRAAKVVAITGGVLALGGTVQFARTVQANRKHLEIAGDHAKAAVSELSTSVTPQSTDV